MNKFKHYPVIMLFGALLMCPLHSMAAGLLKLSTTELRLVPHEHQGSLYAQNIGDSPLYLDVEQALVLNPTQKPEQLLDISQVPKPGLLVTPARLVLAPGQKYRMNIKTLDSLASNQVWRVTFRARENVIVHALGTDGVSAPLSVSVGYGVVIYQNPAAPHIQSHLE